MVADVIIIITVTIIKKFEHISKRFFKDKQLMIIEGLSSTQILSNVWVCNFRKKKTPLSLDIPEHFT